MTDEEKLPVYYVHPGDNGTSPASSCWDSGGQMSDLSERLRNQVVLWEHEAPTTIDDLCLEAADEIERLKAEVARWEAGSQLMAAALRESQAENAKLRSALRAIAQGPRLGGDPVDIYDMAMAARAALEDK